MRIIKIGGSILTVKSSYCTVDVSVVGHFGRQLAGLPAQARGRLVLVIGGGSFGNGVPLRYGLDTPATVDPLHVSRMTHGMFKLMEHLVDAWRDVGVATYPVQASSVISREGGVYRANAGPFLSLLDRGIIPLVTGDLLPLDGWPILSSDWLPVLLAAQTRVEDVTYLTDVDGLYWNALDGATLMETIREADLEAAISMSGGSRFDVTGGMRTKVDAAGALLRLGVPAMICDGRQPDVISRLLKQDVGLRGTRFKPTCELRFGA